MDNTSQTEYPENTPYTPPYPQPKQYYVGINGVQEGPYTEDTLHAQVASGALPADVMVWTEGMPQWEPYIHIFADAKAVDNAAPAPKHSLHQKQGYYILVLLGAAVVVALSVIAYMCIGGDKGNEQFKDAMYRVYGDHTFVWSEYRNSTAYKLMKEAAEAGHVQAQYVHGLILLKGNYDSQAMGVKWLEKAANKNHAYAQEILAEVYFKGTGTQADDNKAIMWLKRAAENKNLDACRKLLELYLKKKRVDISDKKAVDLAVYLYKCGYLPRDSEFWDGWKPTYIDFKILELVEKGVELPVGLKDAAYGIDNESDSRNTWREIVCKLTIEGNAWAQYIYSRTNDSTIREKYLKKAANQGHVMAMISLIHSSKQNDAAELYRQVLKQYRVSAEVQDAAWECWGGALTDEDD